MIIDASKWKLDKDQKKFVESISIFKICSLVWENIKINMNIDMMNNIDDLLSSDTVKVYGIFTRLDTLIWNKSKRKPFKLVGISTDI